MPKVDVWMPLFIGDYLKDTGRLTTEGHGAYLLLIMEYWMAGEAIPDDDEELAQAARMDIAGWKRMRPKIVRFFEVKDGRWHHSRIDDELRKAKIKAETARENGKSGGRPRNPDKTHEEPAQNQAGNPEGNPKGTRGKSSSPSPSPAASKPENTLSPLTPRVVLLLARYPEERNRVREGVTKITQSEEEVEALAAAVALNPEYPWEAAIEVERAKGGAIRNLGNFVAKKPHRDDPSLRAAAIRLRSKETRNPTLEREYLPIMEETKRNRMFELMTRNLQGGLEPEETTELRALRAEWRNAA